MPIVRVS